jgi:threonine dehydrogenase-like Zn-dependent dehydrogenase
MIGIALMGAGRIARVHANAIPAAGARLVTVFDIVEAAAAALASEAGASAALTAEEAFNHPDVAAVLVATSSDTHVDYVIQAVEAGKPVMCEKPVPRLFYGALRRELPPGDRSVCGRTGDGRISADQCPRRAPGGILSGGRRSVTSPRQSH